MILARFAPLPAGTGHHLSPILAFARPVIRIRERRSLSRAPNFRRSPFSESETERISSREHGPATGENPSQSFSILTGSTAQLASFSQRLQLSQRKIDSSYTPLLVLLITPSHISVFEGGEQFIPRLLCQTHIGFKPGQIFDVLIAVVDRISLPREPEHVSKDIASPFPLKTREIGHGDEGISAFLANTETVIPQLWTDQHEPYERQTTKTPQQSTLSFLHQPYKVLSADSSNFRESYPYTSRTIQLPVANTVFQNGLAGTIRAQRWIVLEPDPNPSLVCTKNFLLPRQTIDLTGTRHDAQMIKNCSYSVPAKYITPPRVVTAAMGNVIRQLQIGSTPNEVAPASEELEQCVRDWIAAQGHESEKVDVWALVIPRERWTGQPLSKFPAVEKAVESGSQFYKVLSGGGGWGNKKGLLALDPENDFAPPKTVLEVIDSNDGDLEAEKRRNFGEIVRPGDVVRFAVSLHNDFSSKGTLGKLAQKAAWTICGPRSVVLGTMESIRDVLPASSTGPGGEDPDSLPFLFVPNHFGMLSEQGMSIKVSTECSPGSKISGAEATGTVVQTKLDMPHALLSFHLGEKQLHEPSYVIADLTESVQEMSSKKKTGR